MGLTIPEKGFNIVMRDKRMENEMSMSVEKQIWTEEDARLASAMAAVNELSKSMDPPTGRNYPAWNARKIEARRLMNSKPEDR